MKGFVDIMTEISERFVQAHMEKFELYFVMVEVNSRKQPQLAFGKRLSSAELWWNSFQHAAAGQTFMFPIFPNSSFI